MGLAQLRGGFLDSASFFSRGSSRCQDTRGRGEPFVIPPSDVFILYILFSTYSTFPCQPQVSKGSECDSGRCGRGRCTRLSQPNRAEGEGSACEGPQPHLCLLLGEEHQVKLIFLFLYCLMSLHCFEIFANVEQPFDPQLSIPLLTSTWRPTLGCLASQGVNSFVLNT